MAVAFDKAASSNIITNFSQCGGVAQTVRACGSYPQCPGFNSLHRHQFPRHFVSTPAMYVNSAAPVSTGYIYTYKQRGRTQAKLHGRRNLLHFRHPRYHFYGQEVATLKRFKPPDCGGRRRGLPLQGRLRSTSCLDSTARVPRSRPPWLHFGTLRPFRGTPCGFCPPHGERVLCYPSCCVRFSFHPRGKPLQYFHPSQK